MGRGPLDGRVEVDEAVMGGRDPDNHVAKEYARDGSHVNTLEV
jgi:hypothetical protein